KFAKFRSDIPGVRLKSLLAWASSREILKERLTIKFTKFKPDIPKVRLGIYVQISRLAWARSRETLKERLTSNLIGVIRPSIFALVLFAFLMTVNVYNKKLLDVLLIEIYRILIPFFFDFLAFFWFFTLFDMN
uniref:Uncharacterized protein n=1 Tax=Glossina palpalis gambiensis TaxID=67801 RepID=A0A1B0BH36_9MUSC